MESRPIRIRKERGISTVSIRKQHPQTDWTDEELVELGKDMVHFFKTHPECYLLQDFPLSKGPEYLPMRQFYQYGNHRKVFEKYYDHCKALCGKRQIDLCGKINGLHPTIVNRFLATYFGDVKATEREMKTNSVNEIVDAVNIISYKRQKSDDHKASS